ncbi:MAG: WYL domain-containing protein, partial [Candidatus Aminicenantes bacterium]|nr:WYL domain-containing protein [Candidatus Aminicenantes bacterium]
MRGAGNYEVVIEFDPWAADIVRGRQWHASQEVTDLPDGGSRMTMRLSGLEEVERWV